MIYAQRFIELHEDKLPGGKEYLISQFKHGEKTLNTLKEMINEEIEFQREKETSKLIFISIMIGTVGVTNAIFLSLDTFHNLGVPWPMIILLPLSILILLIVTYIRIFY